MLASDHTRLINKFIGLCKNDPKWPHSLRDLGYKVQLVEYTIILRESGVIRPDVIAVSNKLIHAIVADCKGGHNINQDQDDKYVALRTQDLTTHVTVHDPKQLTHDVCYVDDQANHDSLERHTDLPFITFDERSVVKHGQFTLRKLDLKLSSPMSLDDAREPVSYYPFSPEDRDAVIVPHVMRALIVCLTARKRTCVKLTDPDLVDRLMLALDPGEVIGITHAKALKSKIRQIISMLLQNNADLKDQASKLADDKYSTSTLQAITRTCQDIAKQYASQTRLTDDL